MRRRSAVAKPPRKTLVGVAGKGLNFGHNVEPMMTMFPEIKLHVSTEYLFPHQKLIINPTTTAPARQFPREIITEEPKMTSGHGS